MLLEASIKLGVPLNSALTVKNIMEETGYLDVVEVIYQWPVNKWPKDKRMKEIGEWLPFSIRSHWHFNFLCPFLL